MKIVFLQDDFPPESAGGAGMVAASLARQFAAHGFAVSIIAATQDRSQEGKSEWEGVPVYRIYSDYHERWRAWRSLYNPAAVQKVKKILKELEPDIVHVHNVHYHLSYASLKEAKASGAKVFLTAHDAMLISYNKLPSDGKTSAWRELKRSKLRYNPFREAGIRHYLRSVDRIFAISDALASVLKAHGIKKITTMHNAIDAAQWAVSQEDSNAFVDGHGLRGKKAILFGGRISPAKGGDITLLALPKILAEIPDALLMIAGKESEYTRSLIKRAEEMGVAHAVVSLGWLSGDALRCAYASAEIILQPSVYFEPFGLIALEAMAARKPVVASPFGGLPEIVADGESGYLADPRDVEFFVGKIVSLLRDEGRAKAMGAAGYARALKYFSLKEQTDVLLSFYEK